MRTNFTALLAALFFVAGFSGCAGTKGGSMPDWVTNPLQAEDAFYGVGIASKTSKALAKQTADARARNEVVLTIQNKVSVMIRDFLKETMTISGPAVHEYTEAVSEQVGSSVLEGCTIKERYISSADNTWYSLAEYPLNTEARRMILDTARAEMMKQQELYEEFIATQGFDRLEEKVEQLSGE